MAGGDYPTDVWSPSGGWYSDPKHWRRNTVVCLAVIVAISVPIALYSAKKEQRHQYPTRNIPSQIWCKNFPPKPEEL